MKGFYGHIHGVIPLYIDGRFIYENVRICQARIRFCRVEVSLVYTKTGVGEKHSVHIIYSLIWVSDQEILCSQEKVSVLILDSGNGHGNGFCVHQRILYHQKKEEEKQKFLNLSIKRTQCITNIIGLLAKFDN